MTTSKELPPLLVKLKGDGSSMAKTMQAGIAQADAFGKKMTTMGAKWSLAVSAPIALMEGASLMAFGAFDEAMTNSTSIMTNMTGEVRSQMEAVAKELSLNSTTSAKSLAEGYYFLASAGRDAAGAIGALATVDAFAIGGQMDLAKATEYLADAQNSLGMRSTDAAEDQRQLVRVADVITQAANAASASQVEFSDALTTKSGPALRALNKDIEEGMSLLMVYADQGIKGANAGEKLNIMFRDLAAAQRENGLAWTQAGIALYDQNKQMLPASQIVAQFEQKLGKLPAATRGTAMAMLGLQGDVQSAILPLLGMSEKMKEYEASLRNAGGATEEVREKQLKSFNAQMKLTANLVNVLQLEIGEALVPAMMAKNQILRAVLQTWGDLSPRIKFVVANIVHGVGLAGPAMVSLGMASLGVKTAFTQLAAVGPLVQKTLAGVRAGLVAVRAASLTALVPLLPYIAVIAAVGAAVAAVTYFVVGPDGLANAWDTVAGNAGNAWSYITGAMANWQTNAAIISTWFQDNWWNILKDLGNMFMALASNTVSNWFTMQQTGFRLFTAFIGWLSVALPAAWDYVMSGELLNAMGRGLQGALDLVTPWIDSTLQKFGAWAVSVYDYMVVVFSEIGNIGSAMATEIGNMLSDLVHGKLPDPGAMMARMIEASGPRVQAALFKVGMKTAEAMDAAQEVMDKAIDGVKKDFGAGAEDLNFLNTAGDIMSEQMGKLKGPLDGFTTSLTELPNLVTHTATAALQETESTIAQVQEAATTLDTTDPTITLTARKQSNFDAVLAGSAEAVDRVTDYINMRQKAVQMAKGVAADGKPGAPGSTGNIAVTHANAAASTRNDDARKLDKIEQNTRQPRNVIAVADAQLVGDS